MDPIQVAIIGIAIVLLLFGPKKIPEIARALGRARKALEEGQKQ